MTDYKKYFSGKKITLMGLGLLGRGINVAKFLAQCGANLLITDLKSADELKHSIKRLSGLKNIRYVLGKHRVYDFTHADMIIRAPNAPLGCPYLAAAKMAGVSVKMDASLFAELAPDCVMMIGITGTRGKSTVTHLIYEILQLAEGQAVDRKKKRVFLGGNVRNGATLPLLKKVRAGDYVVLELDSWQLQGFGDAKISPQVAVFTNFMPDHMNYYQGDMERYFADKRNIYINQKKGDFLIAFKRFREDTILFHPRDIRGWSVKLLGEHNQANIAAAVRTARVLGVEDSTIKKAVARFSGVLGRLEIVRKLGGVKYVNDTTATTPDAVIAGLKAFPESCGRIVLIAGGVDKQLNYQSMARMIKKYCKVTVLLPGTATDKMVPYLHPKKYLNVSSMDEAVTIAYKVASKGDLVLLSPGAASFGLFQNEYDRGDRFKRVVMRLRSESVAIVVK